LVEICSVTSEISRRKKKKKEKTSAVKYKPFGIVKPGGLNRPTVD